MAQQVPSSLLSLFLYLIHTYTHSHTHNVLSQIDAMLSEAFHKVGCFITHFNGFICDNIFFFLPWWVCGVDAGRRVASGIEVPEL